MKTPQVSVIITTYNRLKLLKKAVKSVLNQSFEDFELIIVNDCSPDKTEKFIKSLKDKRVRYFKTEKNCGSDSKPKNIGIKNAKGTYITFLDDDDFYRQDALRILHTYIEETKVDIIYGDYIIDKKAGWSEDFNPIKLQAMNYITMDSVMVKRNCILSVGGFDEDLKKFKDWNLWIRLQKAGYKFLHIPIIVLDITAGADTISMRTDMEYDDEGNYKPTFDPADCKIFPDNTSLEKRKPLKVAIYTLTMNRLDYTKEMYKAMKDLTGYDFDWFVIDNGSTDGTVAWLKDKVDYAKYNRKNMGLSVGWNQAIELIKQHGDYDIYLKLDNDALTISKDWLKSMIDIFERNQNVILSPYVEGLEGSPGGVLRQRQSNASPYVMINEQVLGLVPNLGGICFPSPIRLFDEWMFDTSYEGNKDYLLSQYAKQVGFSLFYMEQLRLLHLGGSKGQVKDYK